MRIQHIRIFVCAALLGGAFCCADVSARVCFVGDSTCGGFVDFPEAQEPDVKTQCENAGFNKTTSDCAANGENPGAFCPFDNSYVKCCAPEYRYRACVYPQEYTGNPNTDKCGDLYKCKCSDEYKTAEEWKSGGSNCTPGGSVCVASTDDTVRYNKCTCDSNYFPYSQSCSSLGLISEGSCTNSDGKISYRCQCPSTYRTCAYGGAVGAKSCQQGGITLYSSCKSPEDECKNAGYYDDCDKVTGSSYYNGKIKKIYKNNCYYETNSTVVPVPKKYTTNNPVGCENSADACPYAYGYYKCRWSAANYCATWDMTEKSASSSTIPTSCTKDGVQGTVVPCRLDGGENGTGSGKYLGYYKCKLTCEQRMLSRVGAYLQPDTRFGNMTDGSYKAFWLTTTKATKYFKKGKHLFLRGNARIPDAGLSYDANKASGDYDVYADGNSKNGLYASINGMSALYRLNPNLYAECKDDYEAGSNSNSKNPTLTVSLERKGNGESNATAFFSRDFNNINIELSYVNGNGVFRPGWSDRYFLIKASSTGGRKDYIWNNFGLQQQPLESLKVYGNTSVGDSFGVLYGSGWRTVISQEAGTKLTFMGTIRFTLSPMTVSGKTDPLGPSTSTANVDIASLVFHAKGYHIKEFLDANVVSSPDLGPDLDVDAGVGKGGVVIVNSSNVSVRSIMSEQNVDVKNHSTLNLNRLILKGRYDNDPQDNNNQWGGSYYPQARYCVGITVRSGSTVNVKKSLVDVYGRRYIHVSGGSAFNSAAPIRLRSDGNEGPSVVCIASNSSVTAYGNTYKSGVGNYVYTAVNTTGNLLNDLAYYGWREGPRNATQSDDKRIMYSIEQNACIPYNLNSSYKEKVNYSSLLNSQVRYDDEYKNLCTGGWMSTNMHFSRDNTFSDINTFSTPGTIKFAVAYECRNNRLYFDTATVAKVNSWYGLYNDKQTTFQTSAGSHGNHTCNYAKVSQLAVQSTTGIRNVCYVPNYDTSSPGSYAHPGPEFTTSYAYAYNDQEFACWSSENYGCSGKVTLICSGCSYCDYSGVGYGYLRAPSSGEDGFGFNEY